MTDPCGEAKRNADSQTARDGNAQEIAQHASAQYNRQRILQNGISLTGGMTNDGKRIFADNQR